MRRRSLFTIGCTTIFVGLAATHPVLTSLRGKSPPANGDEAQLTPRARIIGVAESLQLHWAADGAQDRPECKLILSEVPIQPDRLVRLNINQPDFGPWRGTVAVYVGQARMAQLNSDPDHLERVAVWCDSFVYGDPALIARLKAIDDCCATNAREPRTK